ncbi:hypothetical protein SmJEL517_g03857 [Synchytrium microbalum]|uniref:K Homology domain-containing protein n=1 Tax=Synchytrium microbalum TaxID=1806994 RepID=A0A507C1A4_9FUNG|nr:uncharacterized protein SmJEL517_g03857 [Synchytrium microbalum]TPX33201.1 hypothetical protein SmJEL517_g03857 [Synchytrium microbalum]
MDETHQPSSSAFQQLQHELQFGSPETPVEPALSASNELHGTLASNVRGNQQPTFGPGGDGASSSPPSSAASKVDLKNEELFPSLPKASGTKPPAWIPPPRPPPTTTTTSSKANGRSRVLPQEKFDVAASLLATNRKATPTEVAKATASKYSGASIDCLTKKSGLSFTVTAKADMLPLIRREILSAVCAQVTQTFMVPPAVRPFIIGKGGSNLHALVTRTMTKITIPRQAPADASPEETQQQDEEDQPVIIIGDPEGVELAKKEIDAIVSERTSKHVGRVNIDRAYQPFVAGPGNATFEELQNEFGVRIHMAPILGNEKAAAEPKKDKDGKVNNPDEIVIIGERDAVRQIEERLKQIHEDVKRRIKTSSLQVSKKQHRFVIGQRGSGLQEIFKETGCAVDVPPASDPSEMIAVRGAEDRIGKAIQAVYARANSTIIEEVDIRSLVPIGTDPIHLVRQISMKYRDFLKELETAHSASIINTTSPSNGPMFEIHAKSRADTDAARNPLKKLISELGRELVFVPITIPREMHKYVVGKGGANIQRLRANPQYSGLLADVVVSNDDKESDDVVIVVRRNPASKNAEAEAIAMATRVKDDLVVQATALADLATHVLDVEGKYHGRIIGAGGTSLKSLLGPYGDRVVIRFPDAKTEDASVNKHAITIRGPKGDVPKVVETLQAMLVEWKRLEALSSFKEVITVPVGTAQKTVGASGNAIGWLAKAIREKLAEGPEKDRKSVEDAGASAGGFLNMRVEVSESAKGDIITIYGPKVVVTMAKPLIAERAVAIANTVTLAVHIFDLINAEAKTLLAGQSDILDFKTRMVRRVIGQSQRNLKKLEDRHSVSIHLKLKKPAPKKLEESTLDADSSPVVSDSNDAAFDDGFADGVIEIKGMKKEVESAKKELVELTEYEVLHSYSKTFHIPHNALPHVVGKGGGRIASLRQTYDVQVDIIEDPSTKPPSTRVTIEGSPKNVELAHAKILETVTDTVAVETCAFPLPSHLHKHVIGPGGQRIKAIVDAAGGPDKAKVQFPKMGAFEGANEVELKGSSATLQILKDELQKVIQEIVGVAGLDSPDSDSIGGNGMTSFTPSTSISGESIEQVISIPITEAPRVIGKNGETAIAIMKKNNVTIYILPPQGNEAQVRIVGKRDTDIESAKAEVLSKLRTTVTISLPALVMEAFQAGGLSRDVYVASIAELAKQLKANMGVTVELSNGLSRGKTTDGGVVVRGGETLPAALKEVQKLLNDIGQHAAHMPIDNTMRPHVIGREGRNLVRMRAESGAYIELLKVPSEGRNSVTRDVVVIRGTPESVELATQLVNDILKDQEKRRSQSVTASSTRQPTSLTSFAAPANGTPARIDDETSSEGGMSIGTGSIAEGSGVPGWSGRPAMQHRRRVNKHDESNKSNNISQNSAAVLPAAATMTPPSRSHSDTQWQDVKSRKARAAPADGKQPIPGTPTPQPPQQQPVPTHSISSSVVESVTVPETVSVSSQQQSNSVSASKPKKVKQQQNLPPGAAPPKQHHPQPAVTAPAVVTPPISVPVETAKPTTPETTTTPEKPAEDEWSTVSSVRKFKDNRKKAEAAATPSATPSVASNTRPVTPAPADATPATDASSESGAGTAAKKPKKKKSKAATQLNGSSDS